MSELLLQFSPKLNKTLWFRRKGDGRKKPNKTTTSPRHGRNKSAASQLAPTDYQGRGLLAWERKATMKHSGPQADPNTPQGKVTGHIGSLGAGSFLGPHARHKGLQSLPALSPGALFHWCVFMQGPKYHWGLSLVSAPPGSSQHLIPPPLALKGSARF